jgi:hypothetical protein
MGKHRAIPHLVFDIPEALFIAEKLYRNPSTSSSVGKPLLVRPEDVSKPVAGARYLPTGGIRTGELQLKAPPEYAVRPFRSSLMGNREFGFNATKAIHGETSPLFCKHRIPALAWLALLFAVWAEYR